MPPRLLSILCVCLGTTLGACASVAVPSPKAHRNDDAKTLRLQHLRLWTNGGYPLWMEARAARTTPAAERTVTLVFTTTISPQARLDRCEMVTLRAEDAQLEITDVRYAKTAMELQTEAPTLHQRYHEQGIVEDVYVTLPLERLLALTRSERLTGSLCQLDIRFDAAQQRMLRRLAQDAQRNQDAQRESRAANSRASSMLSSMEQ